MTLRFARFAGRALALVRPVTLCFVATIALVAQARADVEVRVEARPVSDPIETYVKVTDVNGDSVPGLDSGDFRVFVDDAEITLQPADVTLPPAQGGAQHISVVFVMDYSGTVQSTALEALETAVKTFIGNLQVGDEAAIVKFNQSRGVSVVQEFLPIDDGANEAALIAAVDTPYSGTGSPVLDGLVAGLNQIATPPHALPAGPKALILVSDGGENQSTATESEVVELANANSVPIFTIGVGDTTQPGRTELLEGLGDQTGGVYYPPEPGDAHIEEAYASISELLSNEYLITFASGIMDCTEHELRVEVTGQAPVSTLFTRRTCDTEPDPFDFPAQTGVEPNETITSNEETITGLTDGVPAHISVIQGAYSIGCNGTFTTDPSEIANGDTVCVEQQASGSFSTSKTTTLTIGGIAGTFTTTTRADNNGGGGGGGGGGGLGLLELLLLFGLGAHVAGRRQAA
jgi:VWFA-related protein